MIRYVLDTDMLTLLRNGHAAVSRNVAAHPLDELAVTVITVEEVLAGWYSRLRQAKRPDQLARAYERLRDSVIFLNRFEILTYTVPAIARAAQLRQQRLKIGTMDLRLAAIVLEQGATLVTRNRKDFQQIPNLVIEDWSV